MSGGGKRRPIAAALLSPAQLVGLSQNADVRERTEAYAGLTDDAPLTEARGAPTEEARFDDQDPSLPTAAADPLLGIVLHGWRLERSLGAGTYARVYRARHVHLGSSAAVKVLRGTFANAKAPKERMAREAKALLELVHPNIVRVFDYGVSSGGLPFMVMELLEGSTLQNILKRGAPPRAFAQEIATQIAQGLGAAHALGFVHRDLKPANILLTPNDVAKILDFGLSRSLDSKEERLTRGGALIGTPLYMAPEQIRGEADAGPAVDVYALGVIFYEMIAGHPPFSGSIEVVMEQHLRATPRPLPEFPLATLALQMLAKDPLGRPADGRAVAEALATAISFGQQATQGTDMLEADTHAASFHELTEPTDKTALSAPDDRTEAAIPSGRVAGSSDSAAPGSSRSTPPLVRPVESGEGSLAGSSARVSRGPARPRTKAWAPAAWALSGAAAVLLFMSAKEMLSKGSAPELSQEAELTVVAAPRLPEKTPSREMAERVSPPPGPEIAETERPGPKEEPRSRLGRPKPEAPRSLKLAEKPAPPAAPSFEDSLRPVLARRGVSRGELGALGLEDLASEWRAALVRADGSAAESRRVFEAALDRNLTTPQALQSRLERIKTKLKSLVANGAPENQRALEAEYLDAKTSLKNAQTLDERVEVLIDLVALENKF
ncbi:MAG: serine/threonine protein kinase [Deltaproteobacteria bacterium]|nr:serine/threonine protein kinase [Deltaproteobacteria bacterium]